MHGSTATLTLRDAELIEWAKPLTHDGDSRSKFANNWNDKVHIFQVSATEFRVTATNCFGSIINHGGTRFETVASNEDDARARADVMVEALVSGRDINEVLAAYALAKATAEVVAEAEQITAAAAPSTTEAPALASTHRAVRYRAQLTATQQAAVNTAVNGIIGRSATAKLPTLQVLAKAGYGDLLFGSYNDPTRDNQVIGLRLR